MSLKRKKMDLSWAWVGLGYGIAIIWDTLLYSLLLKKKKESYVSYRTHRIENS